MITIGLLKDHPDSISRLAEIWHEVLGKIWVPDSLPKHALERFSNHLNDDTMPLTLVAFYEGKVVGMASLRENDGIREDLTPWLGSLVVDPAYQRRGVAPMLINAIKQKAESLGFNKLYLFSFDPTIYSTTCA